MDLTPVDRVGDVWLKRDDAYTYGGVVGGKVRTARALVDAADSPQGLITAGAAHSPQVSIIAHVGAAMGLPVRVHVPARKTRTPEVADAAAAGADVVEHRPGRNSVVVARARADADANPGWVHIPFGMECQEAVDATARQVANLPGDMARLVVPVGSAMTLAGILHGFIDDGLEHVPVLGVVVGAEATDRLDQWAPDDWRSMVDLVDAGTPYDKPADQTLWWGVELDAHYEAKAAAHVQPGECLWVVGIRASQHQPTATPDADGVVWDGPDDLRKLLVPVDDLTYHPRNVRLGDVGAIAASLQAHGQYRAIASNRPTSHVLTGNHTLRAARSLGWTHIATTWLDVDDDEALRIVLVDNQLSDIAANDQVGLSEVLAELATGARGLAGTGFDGNDLDQLLADLRADPYGKAGAALGTLRERFVVPPFSVLDGRQGYWRQRKAAWLETGIKGQEGRAQLDKSTVDESGLIDRGKATTGGSVFDPVLAEVAYRWYCPPGGTVLDPFAGGTTRGAVAALLGYHYTGVELRPEQVDGNQAQWAAMADHATGSLQWLVGDSAQLPRTKPKGTHWRSQVWAGAPYDMLLTSPPYFDLEPYSSDQLDGSQAPTWPEFVDWYHDVLARACALLRPNSFAVLVVGEIRSNVGGHYLGLVGATVDAMRAAGMDYFNEAAYITPIGSLPVRTAAQFPTSRKLGKGHQNVLVFYNGDPQAIRTDWPELGGADYAQPQEDPIG